MNERRIKGHIVGIDGTRDDFYFTLELEDDSRKKRDKKRRVAIPVPRVKYDVLALLDAAFLKDYTVSMMATYEERNGGMLVYNVRGVKVEEDE